MLVRNKKITISLISFSNLSALQHSPYCLFSSVTTPTAKWTCSVDYQSIQSYFSKHCSPGPRGLQKSCVWCSIVLIVYVSADTEGETPAQTSFHILQEKLLMHACIKVVQCRDSGICPVWALTCFEHKISGCCLVGWNKNGIRTVCIIMCMHRHTHTHYQRQRDTHKHTNTHNRKSVNEWEGAGRLAGAVLVEDMASVHLSISKHSQLSSLSTGGEVISFCLCTTITNLSSFLLPPSAPAFSPVSFIYSPPLPFIPFPFSFYLFFFFQHSPAFFSFSTPPFLSSSPSPPSSAAPRRLLRSQWNSPFSNKTKLPTASHTG